VSNVGSSYIAGMASSWVARGARQELAFIVSDPLNFCSRSFRTSLWEI
jgi:hypothetical protein